MKKLLFILISIFITSVSFAANPSGYSSLHGDYGQFPSGTDSVIVASIAVPGYMPRFRVFVPPGTQNIYLVIYDYGGKKAIVSMGKLPVNLAIPSGYTNTQSRSLEELSAQEQIITEGKGKITIFNQAIPTVTLNKAGWMYVYVTGDGSSSIYSTKLLIYANPTIYNTWYQSINWDRDVEGVTIYGQSSPAPTPVPTPIPTPYPTPMPIPVPGVHIFNFGELGVWNWNGTNLIRH